jgi:energy-converting hydrogenase Eha subunit A
MWAQLRAALRTTVPFGLAAGTLYFVIIGFTATLFSVFGAGGFGGIGLVLFIGIGALFGLVLGLLVGLVLGLALRPMSTPWRTRMLAAALGAAPVLAVVVPEYFTGFIGVLAQDATTVIVVPTAVAAIGSAGMSTRLTGQEGPAVI